MTNYLVYRRVTLFTHTYLDCHVPDVRLCEMDKYGDDFEKVSAPVLLSNSAVIGKAILGELL